MLMYSRFFFALLLRVLSEKKSICYNFYHLFYSFLSLILLFATQNKLQGVPKVRSSTL